MKVSELKQELEERELDTTGLKTTLQLRLSEALRQEGHDPGAFEFRNEENEVLKVIDGLKEEMAKNSLEDKLDEHSTRLEEEMENNLRVVKEQITTVEQNIKEQMSTVEQNFQRQVQNLEERIVLLEIGKSDIAEAKTA